MWGVWGVCGVCCACVGCVVRVCVGECVGCGRVRGEKVSLAPLYYPDTLVNPDTCLGEYNASKLWF